MADSIKRAQADANIWKNPYLHRLVWPSVRCCFSSSWGMLNRIFRLRSSLGKHWSVLVPLFWPASAVSLQKEAEMWGSDKICRSRSYSPITLGSFQTCTSAVMGMRFCVQQSTLWHYITLSKNTGIAWTRMEEPQHVQAGCLKSVYGQKPANYIIPASKCMMSIVII